MMPHTSLDAGGPAHRRAAAGGVVGLRSGVLRAAPGVASPARLRRADVRIVTLNMGLVRASLPTLAPLIEGRLVAEGRPLRPADVDAVAFSEPGFVRAHTYALLPRVRRMCALHGLRLIVLQKPDPSVAAVTLRQLPPPGDPARAAWASRRMTWPSIGRGSCCPSAPG